MKEKITTKSLIEMKQKGEKIAALTAYEYIFAKMLDKVGIDLILVGDSLGNIFAGYDSTVPVTMQQMLYHTRIVSRFVKRALVVGDMPFLSYQISKEEAIRNAGQLLQEAGAEAVKLEGGMEIAETVRKIVSVGIPVMGHLGLTPQSVHALGGYDVQAQTEEGAKKLLEDAKILEDVGVFSLVLEKIPHQLAKEVSSTLRIPTIGIGAGPYCDGQILITQDILGLFERYHPKFVRQYAQLGSVAKEALSQYIEDVKGGGFPSLDESF